MEPFLITSVVVRKPGFIPLLFYQEGGAMKWLSKDTKVAEHGDNTADFWSTDQERGRVSKTANWPALLAASLAVAIALLLLFLL